MKKIIHLFGVGFTVLSIFAADPVPAAEKTQITPFNKASSILGMMVKDPAGKDLGKVAELVIDLEAQNVGYAVIALHAGGGGARMVPVPITALKPNKDSFLLNMSEAVLAAASGVANDDWPSLDSFAVGSAAGSEKGQGSSSDSPK